MNDHRLIEELLSARALGGLDAEGDQRLRTEMARHGRCEDCARLESESAEAAGRLAFALEPVPVTRDLEERTLARLRAAGAPSRPAAVPDGGTPERPARAEPAGRATWLRPLAAAAAAVALFVGGWAAGSLGRGDAEFPLEEGRVVTFQGELGRSLSLVYRPGDDGLYLVGSNVETLSPDRTYALWLFPGDTPVNAGCFDPSGDGEVLRFVDATVGAAHTAAVTEEAEACPSAPTTDPLFTAAL
jgi:hypothetical protein